MRQCPGMSFERGSGQRISQRPERAECSGRDPLETSFRDYPGGAVEVFGGQQVSDGLLPRQPAQEVGGATLMFRGDASAANFTAQSPAQETLEERMQAILFAAPIAGHRDEDVAAHEFWQQACAV